MVQMESFQYIKALSVLQFQMLENKEVACNIWCNLILTEVKIVQMVSFQYIKALSLSLFGSSEGWKMKV